METETKIVWPSPEVLEEMSHAELAELLAKHGVTEDDLKSPDLNSKDKRRAKVRELMGKAGGTLPPLEIDPIDTGAIEDNRPEGNRSDDLDRGYEPPPRKTFREAISEEVRAAHARGDHGAHAALHNFEIAVGDFRRAAERLVRELPEGSELGDLARHIVEDL